MVKKLYLLFACFAICLGVVAQDKKVAIGNATVSSYHNGEGADKAIDGETSTIWHSGNGGGYTTSFPVTFTIAFREVCHVDYVRYIPRLDGNSNGNWKDVKVSYCPTKDGNNFINLGTYDLKGNGSVFDFFIGQTCGMVKFEIKSGQGGWASASEVEAYAYNTDKPAAFARYFTDELYTQLKSGVTSSDGIADADVKALVSSMLDNASEYKKFRVGEYEAYETLGTLQQRLKTKNQYSRYENPTGVYFSEGQSYLVAVSGIEDDAVRLKVKNWYTSESSSTYSLHNGLNYIMATTEGNVFVNYYTDNYAKASKVKVHFINVPVIGYWDQNMTNDDWVDLLADKAYDDHRIIITQSEHAQLAFPISAWKTHCPTDVEALMEHYQNVQWALRDMMGLEKYGYQTKNRQLFYTVNGGFMAAGEEGAYCDYADLGGIMNVNSFDFWGVGHEWGHNNQIHPGFHWSGCGETTNNIYASWAQYHFTDNRDADGKPTYLRLEDEVTGVNDYSNMRGGRMQTYFEEGLRKGIQWQLQDGPDYHNVTPDTKVVTGCDAEGNNLGQVTTTSRNYDHFVKLAPFWQLNLWGNLANKCPDIITDVIHRIRTTDNYAAIYNTNGKQQINWMKLACDVAGIDLLPFFEKAGMLVPIHAYIEDYGAGWNIIDEQMIANLKAYVKQKGYPSYTEEINYINAHNMHIYRDNLKLNVTAIEGTLNGDKVNIQHSVAQNAVAFETYNVHDELIRITMYGLGSDDVHSYTQVLFPSSQDAAYIMAVGYNGDRQKVYQKHDSEEGGITSLSKLSNGVLYHISQPHHSVGATSWAVQTGGMALKSNADLSINVDRTDVRQQFAFVSNDGGSTRYLYHVAESKFVNKDGSLGIKPMDAISLKPGAYSNTFVAYFDESHYVNVGGSRQMTIDGWTTSDGGNSCVILPVGEFDVTAALKAFVVEVASITLSDSQVNLVEGDSLLLVATVTPEDATDKRIVWSSSDPLVATVDPLGKVTAVSSGTTTITASSGGKSASCVVTVEKFVGITSVSELKNGDLYHIYQPHHSYGATSWAVQTGGMALKSNADLSINVDGMDIRQQFAFVSNDGGSTRYLYHVAESKFVNKDGSLGIKPMDAISLKPGAYSNTFVAYFDESHYVNVGGSRQMIIDDWKTSDGGNSCVILPVGEFDVTAALKAFVVEVASITLSDSQVNLVEGDSLLLVATVTPEDATDKRIVWSSSDPLVATVDPLGKVTAVSSGTTTITASSGGKSASCVVTVEKFVGITSVSELKNGDLYHIYQPHHSYGATSWVVQTGGMALKSNADLSINVDGMDIRQQFAFVSNDGGSTRYLYHVAESKFVNKDGSLGIKPMDAISLKSGAYSNTFVAYFDESHYVNVGGSREMRIDGWTTSDGGNSCVILPVGEFDVTAALKAFVVEVASITLSDSLVSLIEGDSLLLFATVTPEDATDKRIVWSSSDPLVATVDPLGKVTAVSPGAATITASSGTVSASCDVVVSRKYIPVEEIVLSDSLVSLIEGDSLLLFATVTPEDATDKLVVWSSSDPLVASVDTLGKVTAVSPGAATITASSGTVSASCDVVVSRKYIPVEEIVLSDSLVSLIEGDSLLLFATVTPEDATDKRIVWSSSDPLVATVDSLGKVTAVSPGAATITASSGTVSASCDVVVSRKYIPVEEIVLSDSLVSLIEGDSLLLFATVTPEDATDKRIVWSSSDPLVATVDSLGKVTAVSPGAATITASSGTVSASCDVVVSRKYIPVEEIVLSDSLVSLIEGDSLLLFATVTPEDATDKRIVWSSSDPLVAYVDTLGKVTAVSPGAATITASSGTVSASCDVVVSRKYIPVEEIVLSDSLVSLIEGDSLLLFATVTPEDATDKRIVWSSSDPLVATVDSLGKVTAVSPGAATITASSGTVSASCDVVVSRKYIPVEEIVLSDSLVSLIEGDSLLLFATVTPEDATDKRIVWSSSDPLVATVDSLGKVTAVSPGAATITASSGTVSASCDVVVSRKYIPVEEIVLSDSLVSLIEGDSLLLFATVTPEDATDKRIVWSSSDPLVATVDSLGKVTAVSPGAATITASSGTVSASCDVVVSRKYIPVEEIVLSDSLVSLIEGDSLLLFATVTPEDATDKRIVWSSSDPLVASVDTLGKVTAVSPGAATITASSGTVSASCDVVVSRKYIPVEEIVLSDSLVSLIEGDSLLLFATVTPEDATDKRIVWSSSDPLVASVDTLGKVTAVSPGAATITASSGTVSASCDVVVSRKYIPVEEIVLSDSLVSLIEGDSLLLFATVTPEDATDKRIVWSSSDPLVASVDTLGKVTAVSPGAATITASSGTVSASCDVVVSRKYIPVEGVILDVTSADLIVGDSLMIRATVYPDNATDKTILWSSSNDAVASVDSNGTIVALSVGTAIIRATSNNYEASCVIVVNEVDNISSTQLNEFYPVDIYDMKGRLVKKRAFSISNLKEGFYLIKGRKYYISK